MTSSATPTDAAPPAPDDVEVAREDDAAREDDDADDADADAEPAPPAAREPKLWLGPIQGAVLLVLMAASLAAHGLEPPTPAEVLLVALPAFAFGHVLAFVLRDWRRAVVRGDESLAWARHVPRLVAVAAVLVGWSFIGWHERFRMTPPTAFLCLGWLAVVEAVLFLWRTGFVTAEDLDDHDVHWWRPRGERDELEREKRSLLKAIKEIEFDREMGKTTDQEAGQIVRMYRARAIDVIKAIDELDGAGATTVRDEIEREVRARIAVSGKGKKKKSKKAEGAS
jgi:hypothetical protein